MDYNNPYKDPDKTHQYNVMPTSFDRCSSEDVGPAVSGSRAEISYSRGSFLLGRFLPGEGEAGAYQVCRLPGKLGCHWSLLVLGRE